MSRDRSPSILGWLVAGLLGAIALLSLAIAQPPALLRELAPVICPGAATYMGTETPAIAITIDDGPSADPRVTAAILDVLAARDARATFFLIGENLRAGDLILARLLPEGHELGNHQGADRPSVALGPIAFAGDLDATDAALKAIATADGGNSRQPHWLRPGSGFCSAPQQALARDRGYRLALGSIWPYDTLPIPPALAARFILAHLHPGGIVVLHDGGPDDAWGKRTAQTLALVLPQLQARGYRTVTLSELAALGERVPPADNAWPQWGDRLRGRAIFGFVIRKLAPTQARTLLALFAVADAAILLLGFTTGFLHWQWLPGTLPLQELLYTSARLLLFPAILEEWLFRGLFLPAAAEFDGFPDLAASLVGLTGLLLYVVLHVPSGYFTDRRTGGKTNFFATFARGDALACTTILGLACTLAYLSCGSLYPAIAEHWIVVLVWFFACGGYDRLYPNRRSCKDTAREATESHRGAG